MLQTLSAHAKQRLHILQSHCSCLDDEVVVGDEVHSNPAVSTAVTTDIWSTLVAQMAAA